jgi:predicted SprT family Zn-dependent metalloprotease
VHKHIQIAVSLACLAIIGGGARYAYGRESLRTLSLPSLYQQIDQEHFGGELPEATIEWADIPGDLGKEQTWTDGSITIWVSRTKVTSEEELKRVLEHEACHAYVDQQGGEAVVHGAQWQACMGRFQ